LGQLGACLIAAATFVAIGLAGVPLVVTLLGLGGPGWGLTWHRLGQEPKVPPP
jgi:hypothetical protein